MERKSLIKENERLDDLLNGYYLIQDPSRFCFGIDAVLLSSFVNIKPWESVVDLGTGNGILPVLLASRTKCTRIEGLEIQEECVDAAIRSVAYNGLEDRIHITQGDIKEAAKIYGAASFHVIICNPPYMTGGHGLLNQDLPKAIARHEIKCTLQDIASQAAAILPEKGRLYMIHRPFRLVEIFDHLSGNRLEPKRMRMVHPYVDKEPAMVLIEARKGGSSRLKVEAPLIIYDKPGVYTQEVLRIYDSSAKSHAPLRACSQVE